MIRAMIRLLPFLIPLGITIVAVTTWSRQVGGPVAVIVPPAFAFGSAALTGTFLNRRSRRKRRDDEPLY